MTTATPDWQEQNREYLALAVDHLFARLEGEDAQPAAEAMAALAERMDDLPSIDQLAESFELSPFERDIALLCFASELDPRFRVDAPAVTIGTVLETLPGANWSALDAGAPLRSWGIVVADPVPALADSPLRLAGDVLRFLMGFDPRIEAEGPFSRVPEPPLRVAGQLRTAEEVALTIARTYAVTGGTPAVELHGAGEEERLAIASTCAELLGAVIAGANVRDLPPPGEELDRLLRTWSRIGQMTATLLCLTGTDSAEDDPAIRHRLDRALDRIRGPFFVSVRRPTTFESARPLVRRRVDWLTTDERLEVWRECVDATRARLRSRRTRGLSAELAALAGDFRVGARTMERICLEAEAMLARSTEPIDPPRLAGALREGCARWVRAQLDPVAERVALESVADVALPEEAARQFAELELTIRFAHEVGETWGLGHGRTAATTALFAGPSGTGKTHAAYVLARRLGRDLYRASLASVLSKYIGETEKNLDRIFDAAATGGVILLFDEADALFGKRSEVRDSHDRYANLSTAHLLSRIEDAPTPTILTTNLKEAIDPAFVRRLHFVIDFPFPAGEQREVIWSHVFPERTPVGELAPERLSAVAATGGTIANIARRGAFMAAAEPGTVEMHHLFEASRRELRKLGRDMTPDELEAWR
jgi:hypothetical protein